MAGVARSKVPQVMQLYLLGWRTGEIAQVMGVSAASISQTIHDPAFQEEVKGHEDHAVRELMERRNHMAMLAAMVFQDVATDRSAKPSDRIAAARELADRFGLTKEASTRALTDDHAVSLVLEAPAAPRYDPED